MRIFWSEPVAENAQFVCYPFGEKAPIHIRQKVRTIPPPASPIEVQMRSFLPSQEEWISNIAKTIVAIENQVLQKVVLARVCSFVCSTPPDPFAIAARLLKQAKNSIVYCLSNEKTAFLGATPEILFSRKGRTIQTEAVAGTLPRGTDDEEDLALENKLLKCPKAQSEVLPVINTIQKLLSPLCRLPLVVSPINVRKTPNVQHLCASIQGILKHGVSDDDIVKLLHPTPALCGLPQKEAFDWIQDKEPFKRGLYGGILGWWTPEESCFAVAIRSCLVQDANVKLFTGAGIVATSNPLDEWEELNSKMNLYKDIFV